MAEREEVDGINCCRTQSRFWTLRLEGQSCIRFEVDDTVHAGKFGKGEIKCRCEERGIAGLGHRDAPTYQQQTDERTKIGLDLVGTRPASLQFAVLALKYVPVRTTMAHIADPLNQR